VTVSLYKVSHGIARRLDPRPLAGCNLFKGRTRRELVTGPHRTVTAWAYVTRMSTRQSNGRTLHSVLLSPATPSCTHSSMPARA
jgi:hypothetical protein